MSDVNIFLVERLTELLKENGIELVRLPKGSDPEYGKPGVVYWPEISQRYKEAQPEGIRVTADALTAWHGWFWHFHVIVSEAFDRNDVTAENTYTRLNEVLRKARMTFPGFRLEFQGVRDRAPWGQGHMELTHQVVTVDYDPERGAVVLNDDKKPAPTKGGSKKEQ